MPLSPELKLRIFMFCFHWYTLGAYKIAEYKKKFLHYTVKKLPDKYLYTVKKSANIKIINAKGFTNKTLPTNILNSILIFIKCHYNPDSCEGKGGFYMSSLKAFYKPLGLKTIWISYLFDSDELITYDPDKKILNYNINYMSINLETDQVFKYKTNFIADQPPEEIMFGQVSLNPDFKWD